jgi:hypothetical protein
LIFNRFSSHYEQKEDFPIPTFAILDSRQNLETEKPNSYTWLLPLLITPLMQEHADSSVKIKK